MDFEPNIYKDIICPDDLCQKINYTGSLTALLGTIHLLIHSIIQLNGNCAMQDINQIQVKSLSSCSHQPSE